MRPSRAAAAPGPARKQQGRLAQLTPRKLERLHEALRLLSHSSPPTQRLAGVEEQSLLDTYHDVCSSDFIQGLHLAHRQTKHPCTPFQASGHQPSSFSDGV